MAELLVSASTGAMGSLLGKLGTMLSDEYKLLKDVRNDITFLKGELEAMQAFLLMMADVEEPDKQAKLRADAVREMSYEIEDSIDKFIILVEHDSTSKSDGFGKLFNKSMKKIEDMKTRHKIAKDVKDIKIQVKEISERYMRYKIDEPSPKPRNTKVDPRIVAVYKDAAELVGLDGPTNELIKCLINKEGESAHQLKVASIVGYGGLGKTTLAKQVYDKLGANFECRAFVSISRTPDIMKILTSMLSQFCKEDYAEAGDPQLTIDQIRNFLKDKRYIIVVDDIWDLQTWRILDCALFKNSRGSVIMTTTRIYDVAKSCCLSTGGLVYQIQPLSTADSKKLFFKRIFGCEEKCPHNLREVSEEILKKCGGLPLAINAISSLLATGKSKEEWDRVGHSIAFAEGKNADIDAMNYILSLSYFDLPLHLRSCLLYLTMFPEDYEIERQRLVHRWISEGFIHSEGGEDLVELGMIYFHELVNRSLIQPVNIGYDGKASYCQVHDTVLDFLISKSTEENFCTSLSNHSKPDRRIRRLYLMESYDEGSAEKLDLSHARSLGVFWFSQEYLDSLAKSNALRVLDAYACRLLENHHVKDIGRLLQLRYLNISCTNITELPSETGNLKYLETLDASYTSLLELPESVTRLKRLARLFVSAKTKFPDSIGNMESLQELADIDTSMQSLKFLEELGKLTNLRKLRLILKDSDKAIDCKEDILVSSLGKLDKCKLCTLCIRLDLTEKNATFSFPALRSIREVTLDAGQLSRVAKWLLSLVNLEKIRLNDKENMEQQDVKMMGSIVSLLELNACTGCIGPMIISGGMFQQLQKMFVFLNMELKFEVGAMPNLKELTFEIQLVDIKPTGTDFDFGIQHLSSLAWLHIMIGCRDVSTSYVEVAELAFKSMAEAHPNHPTSRIERYFEENMLQDDDE